MTDSYPITTTPSSSSSVDDEMSKIKCLPDGTKYYINSEGQIHEVLSIERLPKNIPLRSTIDLLPIYLRLLRLGQCQHLYIYGENTIRNIRTLNGYIDYSIYREIVEFLETSLQQRISFMAIFAVDIL